MEKAQRDVIHDIVLPRYGIRTDAITLLDPHTCLVVTERGMKRLHLDRDERRVTRRHALWEHLAAQGFRRIPRHIRTLYGEPIVTHDDCTYTLSDEWPGRPAEILPLDMRLAGRNLARLHAAVQGLQLPEAIALPKRHGTWLTRFARAGDELAEKFNLWSTLGARNSLQERFVQDYEWVAEQIGRSVDGLVAGRYDEYAARAEQAQTFAVGDYRLSDLLIDEGGRVATLRIDDAVADTPLYDAAKFAHALIERGEQEMAQLFLDAYAETAGLAEQDVVILDAYLAFPHAAYRHLTHYLRVKRGTDVFAERFEQAVHSSQSRRPLLYSSESVRWT